MWMGEMLDAAYAWVATWGAALWGIPVAVGPLLQVRKIVRARSSENIAVMWLVIGFIGFVTFTMHGEYTGDVFVWVPDLIGSLTVGALVVVAVMYRPGGRRAVKAHARPASGVCSCGLPYAVTA
jgi:uncharacterized protein with PQ loop repeat